MEIIAVLLEVELYVELEDMTELWHSWDIILMNEWLVR